MMFEFAIDRGGTFTDIYAKVKYEASDKRDKVVTMKLLSSDPQKYTDAPTEGIRRIMEMEGLTVAKGHKIDASRIKCIRMGTTVATNALLERKGSRTALVVTEGFKDLLKIGNQTRPDIFDLAARPFQPLYEEVIEVKERIIPCLGRNTSAVCNKGKNSSVPLCLSEPLDESRVRKDLLEAFNQGITSLSVVLMHSYGCPDHEEIIGRIAQEIGFVSISLSSQVNPMMRIVPRGHTSCTDAYLTPCIKQYLKNFTSGFQDNLAAINVLFMQSDGGLTPMDRFNGSRAILSGPAGGYVAYALTTFELETDLPVIGFDMGGTSTDVSRYHGKMEHIMETNISGITIQSPQLDISTVAAGGGSVLKFRSGLFKVGPDSAGAQPGPLCYRKGGPLTLTDANLFLGRLIPSHFPKIFGPGENLSLDKEGCAKAFNSFTKEINAELSASNSKLMTVEEVALGFIKVANETMCRPIRAITEAKGYDTRKHALACFGGAGGQHACGIARILGMSTVIIHKYSGILSAYGMALADVVSEAQEPCKLSFCADHFSFFEERLDALAARCSKSLAEQGFSQEVIELSFYLHMRYDKTDCAIMCMGEGLSDKCRHGDFEEVFLNRYKREFGFTLPGRAILVDDIRVRAVARTREEQLPTSEAIQESYPVSTEVVKLYFEGGYLDTKVYSFGNLPPGSVIPGPCVIMDNLSTIIVDPFSTAFITKYGNIKIELGEKALPPVHNGLDNIQLSIFSHRFMSIAEQMGRKLQRTSISTNIKERLDFSCAIFGPDGGLVSNAPHIPVHLGAMQAAVQYQILQGPLNDGDVILSNHPAAGGSHLPDLTVITPVFHQAASKPVFFVANRGHHADVGGITPGSMPPNSKSLIDEGASFISFKLVDRGVFQEKELIEILKAPGKYPGNSGSRTIADNIADLKAQIAANLKGIRLVSQLIEFYSLEVVQAYMYFIQQNAEQCVRSMLMDIGKAMLTKNKSSVLYGEDHLDDGSKISLKVSIDVEQGSAIFDFSGTGYEIYGNLNAPKAITLSAIIYCLRAMIGYDIPLNQGCMTPITTIIPKGCLLDPSLEAAVVGGNVLTSQRIVDVILKTFEVCAASQGCMNNLTFGDETMGYYETIAGGSGAGPSWHGSSGVHTHMTNTRMTDPEILESRCPVIVKRFCLREGSGGRGNYKGGDGIIRELMFRKALTVSLLTERRVFRPYGLKGGEEGQPGLNLLCTTKGRILNLGGKASFEVSHGDILKIYTPGGGGYGVPK